MQKHFLELFLTAPSVEAAGLVPSGFAGQSWSHLRKETAWSILEDVFLQSVIFQETARKLSMQRRRVQAGREPLQNPCPTALHRGIWAVSETLGRKTGWMGRTAKCNFECGLNIVIKLLGLFFELSGNRLSLSVPYLLNNTKTVGRSRYNCVALSYGTLRTIRHHKLP